MLCGNYTMLSFAQYSVFVQDSWIYLYTCVHYCLCLFCFNFFFGWSYHTVVCCSYLKILIGMDETEFGKFKLKNCRNKNWRTQIKQSKKAKRKSERGKNNLLKRRKKYWKIANEKSWKSSIWWLKKVERKTENGKK